VFFDLQKAFDGKVGIILLWPSGRYSYTHTQLYPSQGKQSAVVNGMSSINQCMWSQGCLSLRIITFSYNRQHLFPQPILRHQLS